MISIKWAYSILPKFEKVKLEKNAHPTSSLLLSLRRRIELEAKRRFAFYSIFILYTILCGSLYEISMFIHEVSLHV